MKPTGARAAVSDSLRGPRAPIGAFVGAAVVVAVVVAVAVPVTAVLARSFVATPGLEAAGASPWFRVLGAGRTWRILGLTVGQALVSTLVTVVLGVPLAYALASFVFPGRGFLRTLVTVPFVLPSVVLGAGFSALVGAGGLFDARGSWALIIAAHTCFNLAVVVRTVGAAFGRLGDAPRAAARLLGRGPFGTFLSVSLPQVRSAVAAAAVIVFLFCLTSFGVIVMLGGGSVTTIEVEIWTRATRQFDLGGAAVLSALQLLAVLLTLALDARSGGVPTVVTRRVAAPLRTPATKSEWVLVLGTGLAAGMLTLLPLAALVWRSLQVPGGVGGANWTGLGSVLEGTDLGVSPLVAIGNSLRIALGVTAVALALALPTSRHLARRRARLARSVVLLPLGVSATTIGLGLLIAYGRPPVDLRDSPWLVPMAQLLVALPLMIRVLVPAVRALDPSALAAAALLGAGGRARFWRVELPLLGPSVAVAAGLGFVTCLGEFGATVFVARSGRVTLPVLLQRLMARPGGVGYGQAMALAVVLVVLCGCALSLAERLGGREAGDLALA